MKRPVLSKFIRFLTFIIIVCVVTVYISSVMVNPGMYNYQMIATFPEEPADSLDAVYIGGSNTFTFFQGPLAWKKYGMTVRVFASDGQPQMAVQSFIKYAHKKHPNALYIVGIRNYETEISSEQMHWTADFFPESQEKYQMISTLTSIANYSPKQKLAIYLPILQYHSRWNALTEMDFHRESNGLKGAFYSSTFFNVVEDVTEEYHGTEEKMSIEGPIEDYWNNLLDYCDREKINALFVISPQCFPEEIIKKWNSIEELIEGRGYPVLDLVHKTDELGMDFSQDYYNARHTNIHGCLKVTDYIADYLHKHYDFPEKSGGGYEGWDNAYDKYKEIITPYLTEEELKSLL